MGSDEAVGAALRRLRLQKGISLTDFAEQVGVSRPTIWSWEHGRTHPKENRIPALARALNVSEIELISSTKAGTASGKKQSLEELVAHCKECLAAAAGTTVDTIEIMIKL
jgi:transcriptional regulator with XRE-family HTH domain